MDSGDETAIKSGRGAAADGDAAYTSAVSQAPARSAATAPTEPKEGAHSVALSQSPEATAATTDVGRIEGASHEDTRAAASTADVDEAASTDGPDGDALTAPDVVEAADLGAVRLDADLLVEPKRPVIERIRAPLALIFAAGIHAGLLMGLGGTSAPPELGAGGDDTLSISVEVVSVTEFVQGSRLIDGKQQPRASRGFAATQAGAETNSDSSEAQAESRLRIQEASGRAGAVEPSTATIPLPPDEKPDLDEPTLQAAEREADQVETTDQTEPPPVEAEHPSTNAEEKPAAESTEGSQSAEVASFSSAPSDESAASRLGGGTGAPTDSPLEASGAARLAAGLTAKAFGADVIKSLAELEAHLNAANRERGSTARGNVRLRLTIGPDGLAERITVQQSSGEASLDQRAIQDIARFRFPPAPASLTASQRTYTLPISYR